MKPEACHSIADLRRVARRRLPAPLFHYIDGGADDEWTMGRNTAAFERWALDARVLVDVSTIDHRVELLGQTLGSPFVLSPTGMNRLFHHHKEPGVARAAAEAGCLYSLSTMATTSLEDISALGEAPRMFQVYIHRDRGLTRELVQRCRDAGYQALCLTVDTPLAGNRERDKRTGMVMPPRLGGRSLLSFLMHPRWSWHYLRDPDFRLANVIDRVDALGGGAMSLIDYVNSQFDRSVTWPDLDWLLGEWNGPVVLKGVQSLPDAQQAAALGVTALMLSNHGGRQLDGVCAPVELVAPVRDRLGDGVQIICDGGIRRATHALKALALGADAVSIGRAYLYGLAAFGQAGVVRALDLLHTELQRDMALMGCRSLSELTPDRLRTLELETP